MGYYIKFVANFATLAASLTDLTGKKVLIQWHSIQKTGQVRGQVGNN